MHQSLKKRKIDDSHSPPVGYGDSDTVSGLGLPLLNVQDSLKLVERFTRQQLVEVVQTALLTSGVGVLDGVRLVADRDPAQRTLFVWGISWETTHDTLHSVFSQYGELEYAVVVLDKATGKSKGYAFVTFKHADDDIKALKEPRKIIDNRVTVTKYWSGGKVINPECESSRKIYVGNVPPDMKAERLESYFSMYGEIEIGPIGFDRVTGKSNGFALFLYKTAEAARASVAEPVKNIDGFTVNCRFANTDRPKGKPRGAWSGCPGGGKIVNEAHGDAVGVGMGGQISVKSNAHGNTGAFPGVKIPVNIPLREIYVDNVPPDMPAERLLSRFSMYGEIEEGPLGFDHVTGKWKGFALFVYKSSEAARASVAEPVKNIDGFPLSCKFANAGGLEGKPGWAPTGGHGGVVNEVSGDPGAGVGSMGVGGGKQSVGCMRHGVGRQSGGGSLANGNGGLSSGGYAGTGNTDSGSGAGLGVTGEGIHVTGESPQHSLSPSVYQHQHQHQTTVSPSY